MWEARLLAFARNLVITILFSSRDVSVIAKVSSWSCYSLPIIAARVPHSLGAADRLHSKTAITNSILVVYRSTRSACVPSTLPAAI
jgi:hypothetical protein